MASPVKGILFLSDVEKTDAKLVAVALAQAALTVELSDRIGFDLDDVEFTMSKGGQMVRFKLTDVEPEGRSAS